MSGAGNKMFLGFQPGVSGNPRGRPKVNSKIREAARKHDEQAIQVLAEALSATKSIVVGKGEGAYVQEVIDHPTRIYAANSILDRGHGKPTTDVVITNEEKADINEMSDEQLIAIAMGKEAAEASDDKPV